MSRVPSTAVLLALLAAAIRALWIWQAGIRVSPDGYTYLGWGQRLLDQGVGGLAGHELYAGSVIFVATLIALFGAHATTAWIVLQAIAVSMAAIPLYLLARERFGHRVALVAGLAYALLFESFQWEAYALTDSLFLAVLVSTLYLLMRAEQQGGWWRLGGAGGLVLLATLRPVGFLVVVTYAVWKARAMGPGKHRRALAVAAVVAASAVVALAFVVAPYAGSMGQAYAEANAAGMIVDDDPSIALRYPFVAAPDGLVSFIAANPLGFALLAILRFGAYFLVAVPRYSALHIALNLVTLLPLFALGLWMLSRSIARPGFERFLAALVVVFAAFHALTLLDYDFRYRNPILPILDIFFAAGAVELYDRFAGSAEAWRRRS